MKIRKLQSITFKDALIAFGIIAAVIWMVSCIVKGVTNEFPNILWYLISFLPFIYYLFITPDTDNLPKYTENPCVNPLKENSIPISTPNTVKSKNDPTIDDFKDMTVEDFKNWKNSNI